jgi:hypothetical protein
MESGCWNGFSSPGYSEEEEEEEEAEADLEERRGMDEERACSFLLDLHAASGACDSLLGAEFVLILFNLHPSWCFFGFFSL